MSKREKELDLLAKRIAAQAIIDLHEEFGLDKILLKLADHYRKGHRNPNVCSMEIVEELCAEKKAA